MVSPCLPTTTQADSGDSNLTRGKAGGKAPPVSKARLGSLAQPPAKNGGRAAEQWLGAGRPGGEHAESCAACSRRRTSLKAKAAAPPATEDPAEEEEDDPTDREPN